MASANPHKVAEMNELLQALIPGVNVVPRPSWVGDVVEDADTLVGNARLKAAALSVATGQPAVADDTGLFVDALDGLPGVHTARYAGPNADPDANMKLLLSELTRVSAVALEERRAAFRTVAIVVFPDGREVFATGEVAGHITVVRAGKHGFGYDPIFVPEGFQQTFGQMTQEQKQTISHRARAFTALSKLLIG
jgi:XTP/dITP diphosphohydrolase